MQLRYLIYIVLFLVTSFILNIFFYFVSSDYRGFLKNMKSDKVYTVEQKETNNQGTIVDVMDVLENTDELDNLKKENPSIDNNSDSEEIKVVYNEIIGEIKQTKIEDDFIKRFKEYKLKKIELHPRLFDLTTEYPDEYIEYYSEYLTIYFFGNKSYDSLKSIFKVLTFELPFSINELNNFGNKSFYINLDNEFQDDQVRIVLLYKNRTFGLKMSKSVYPLIKDKLDRLK